MTAAAEDDVPVVFIIAGEVSGDLLAASLMRALNDRLQGGVRFIGVGGERMAQLGLQSLFPMEELVVHGLQQALASAPRLLSRIGEVARAIVEANPDVVVLVDAPGFNLRVARRVRRLRPAIPIVDYVSPSVWAYLPGRARRMTPVVDHLLAILPFEPEVHRKLGGPPTTYVGHPLIERLSALRPLPGERPPLGAGRKPVLLVLPGSRRSEIARLMDLFGATVARVESLYGPVETVLPAVPYLAAEIRERAATWPVRPTIVEGEVATYAAFRRAHAALAASGTVTLELALSGVPTVVAYRVEPVLRLLKAFLKVDSIVLPNIILGEHAMPEFLDGAATPEALAAALLPLLDETGSRQHQLDAFRRLDTEMALDRGTPSERAAEIVLSAMRSPLPG
jgi:lipid-A-disaccharide synthase